jgi:tetratricopeptide (TPR) repeat protein
MADQAWGPRGTFLVFVGRLREAVPLLERARAENPFEPNIAGYLGYVYAAGGDFDAAFAEIERGLALDGPDTPLRRAGLILALNHQDRRAIDERVRASPELPAALARLLDTPAEAAAEIRRMAAAASSPIEKGALAYWAAYFEEPELSLELWPEGTRDPDGLWQPLMRDVRALPAFKEVVRELGLVDYWRVYGWSDFCRPVGDEDFSCS